MHAGALVDRVQAVLLGGSAATGKVLCDVAVFRRELKRSLRARREQQDQPEGGETADQPVTVNDCLSSALELLPA